MKSLAKYNVFLQKDLDPTKKNYVDKTLREEDLDATFGSEWKRNLNDFFSGNLELSNIATEQYLKMNSNKYKLLLEERAVNFLNYAMENTKKSK